MRYLISILVVLAFAVMATNAQAVCPSDDIGPFTDSYLKLHGTQTGDSNPINPALCPDVDWNWDFTRTSLETGCTKVWAAISNTTVLESIESSSEYPNEGNFNKNGSGEVDSSPIQSSMYLDARYRDCGHFTNMEFDYGTLKK